MLMESQKLEGACDFMKPNKTVAMSTLLQCPTPMKVVNKGHAKKIHQEELLKVALDGQLTSHFQACLLSQLISSILGELFSFR